MKLEGVHEVQESVTALSTAIIAIFLHLVHLAISQKQDQLSRWKKYIIWKDRTEDHNYNIVCKNQ